ncbi:DUF2075 domain-containing protein [Corynebacterium sp. CCUG 59401]|nr:DUF2075 domain-containing protein [Corynebacterium pseudogenitalium]
MSGARLVQFANDPPSLVEEMLRQFAATRLPDPSLSERNSWRNSLPKLATELQEAQLEDVDVFLEYRLPLTSQRADVVLAGIHPKTGEPSVVVMELKQWTAAEIFEDDPSLVSVPGYVDPQLHPSRQVNGYRRYLSNYLTYLHNHDEWVHAVAFMHGLDDPKSTDALRFGSEEAPIFTGVDRKALREFLQNNLIPGGDTAERLINSSVAPSTKLMEVAAEEVREREKFILLGEQQRAVDIINHEVKRAASSSKKRVVVVSGGPGSGKSAIALSVLGELGREGRTVLHATGSRSFTTTMRKVAGHRSKDTQSLFKYFNSFTMAQPNGIDVLIADEAHRIRATSNNRYTKAELRSHRLQIDELVSAARAPVFLLDDNQVVRHGELGSTRDIRNFAKSQGYEVTEIQLGEQFRCGGSAAYVEWVEQILGLTKYDPAEAALADDESFAVEVVDSPWEMERVLRDKDADGYTARMTAGFCWPWSDAGKEGLVNDVVIGDWERPWNNKSDRRVGTAPPSALWATMEGGFEQIGCVYTAQGFEFDWAGVILGPDLIWRDGRFTTIRSCNKDPHFHPRNKISDENFDILVRHVYKVLLTRGMIGTVLYSPDKETRQALRTLLY